MCDVWPRSALSHRCALFAADRDRAGYSREEKHREPYKVASTSYYRVYDIYNKTYLEEIRITVT